MLTSDEINKALREVDPTAKVVFMVHDEIEIACAEECKDAVHRRLSDLTFAHFQKEHAAEAAWLAGHGHELLGLV